ncbi:hypothetical protein GCM10010503_39130 [Streptomyces lucensis JCM 4490]|uniref:Uncharacterized protein n=1 Tax=Streptomyces lucensis JCM 4490 TaxID=1306176 RepID=A0A918J848_9ACTN|nr:hypothetical protein [Streptomyces lucensis]GGW58267.1 hypothetical protein GCM10010503_39130 [Streptomyces lucensis JCM 4490]
MEAYDAFARMTPGYCHAVVNDIDRDDLRAAIGVAQLGVTQAHFRILAFGPEHLRNPSGAVREALQDYADALGHWDRAEERRDPTRHRLEARALDVGATMAQNHSDFVDEVTAYISSSKTAGGSTG